MRERGKKGLGNNYAGPRALEFVVGLICETKNNEYNLGKRVDSALLHNVHIRESSASCNTFAKPAVVPSLRRLRNADYLKGDLTLCCSEWRLHVLKHPQLQFTLDLQQLQVMCAKHAILL